MTPASAPAPAPSPSHDPSTILLFRTPVPPAQGTDPYHDAFGTFCLPSFPLSALDSGAATPVSLLPMSRVNSHSSHGDGKSPGLTSTSLSGGGAATTTATGTGTGTGPPPAHPPTSAGPRPEELLLHALQHQQQQQQQQQSSQRESSPGRKYTRRQPSYHSSSSDSAQSSQSFVLTTHHLTQYVPHGTPAPPDADADADDAQCIEREWCVTSLPVLGTDDANAQQFQELLAEGDWGAVVATSGRAWDVWKSAAIRCQRKGKSPKTNYPETPFFLISSRSAATFRSTTLPDVPSLWAPKANKVYGAPPVKGGGKKDGPGGGNGDKAAGEALAEYIIGWLERRRSTAASAEGSGGADLPLIAKAILLLQGDKALPALPRALDAQKIPYESIVVYATCEDRFLMSNLDRQKAIYECLSSGEEVELDGGAEGEADGDGDVDGEGDAEGDGEGHVSASQREAHEDQTGIVATPDWIVFFSPSGVDYCAPHLVRMGWFPDTGTGPSTDEGTGTGTEKGTGTGTGTGTGMGKGERRPSLSFSARTRPHYVALGPTTAAHLKERYGLVEGPRAGAPAPMAVAAGADGAEAKAEGRAQFDFVTAASPDPQGVREAVERGEGAMR